MTSPSRRLGNSNNKLNCLQVKSQFQASGIHHFSELKCAFFSKKTNRIWANFFSGFKRKKLFITTCIEKYCTRPLITSHVRTIILYWWTEDFSSIFSRRKLMTMGPNFSSFPKKFWWSKHNINCFIKVGTDEHMAFGI